MKETSNQMFCILERMSLNLSILGWETSITALVKTPLEL